MQITSHSAQTVPHLTKNESEVGASFLPRCLEWAPLHQEWDSEAAQTKDIQVGKDGTHLWLPSPAVTFQTLDPIISVS